MAITDLLTLQGPLFLLILLGIFVQRRMVDEAFQKGLTDLVLGVVLPCNILSSFQMELTDELLRSSSEIFLISVLIQAGCGLLAAVLYRRCAGEKRPSLQYCTICSNAGFLGTAIASEIFGTQGVLLAAIFLIPHRISMWTLGLSYYTKSESQKNWKKALTHPCILAVVIGVVLLMTQIKLPSVLNRTVSALGTCNTGLSMLLTGMVMSRFRWRDFLDPTILLLSAIRLGLVPLLVFICCRVLHAEALASNVALLIAAMPAPGMAAVLAAKYDSDAAYAAGCVTVTTTLSLLTIPLWCMVF